VEATPVPRSVPSGDTDPAPHVDSEAIAVNAVTIDAEEQKQVPGGAVEKQLSARSGKEPVPDLPVEELLKAYPMMVATKDGGHIPFRRKMLWQLPVVPWFMMKYMKLGYMNKFYTDDYPMASLGVMAFFAVLSVIVDAFTDPLMANWTDRFRSKYGRRRPFVLASSIIVPVVYLLSWMPLLVPPGLGASIWFGVFHIFFFMGGTLFEIPHKGWGTHLSASYQETTTIFGQREMFASTGILVGLAVLPLVFVSEACTGSPDDGCWELPGLAFFHRRVLCDRVHLLSSLGQGGQH
jgi:hypothetical protein